MINEENIKIIECKLDSFDTKRYPSGIIYTITDGHNQISFEINGKKLTVSCYNNLNSKRKTTSLENYPVKIKDLNDMIIQAVSANESTSTKKIRTKKK